MDLRNFSFEDFLEAIVNFLPKLGLGLAVLLIARLLSIWLSRLLKRSLQRREVDQELIVLIQLLTRWGIMVIGLVLALEQLAPGRFSSLIAGLVVAGFTLGFALQDVAKNFIAGILLLLQQPFALGDAIEVGGFSGTVKTISLRSTEIITFDGLHVIIPNGEVFVSTITNYSKATKRRIELKLGVAYESNLQQVIERAIAAVQDLPGMLRDPAPFVVFDNFGESAILLSLFYWIDMEAADYGTTKNLGMEKVLQAFQQEGIQMPYPTMTINILDQGRRDPTL